jgi:hypothetical protein
VVDLSVRYVSPSDESPAPVTGAGRPLVGLTLAPPAQAATAVDHAPHSKSGAGGHELRVSILGSPGTSVTDIDVKDGPGQLATARLQVTGPRGSSVIEVQVDHGSTISVRIGRPRRAPQLPITEDVTVIQPDRSPATDAPSYVPMQFRRDFDQERTARRGDD